MKMLAPELSPATVFGARQKKNIAKCDIGEAQRDPWDLERLTGQLKLRFLTKIGLFH